MTKCPTCGRTDFKSEQGMKYHHARMHGEQLLDTVSCDECGDEVERRTSEIEMYGNTFCSRACYSSYRSSEYCGDGHPQWEGGSSSYRGEDWWEVREKIVERDTVCQRCGQNEDGEYLLDVHHITPFRKFDDEEEANDMSNLVLLCRKCHREVEAGKAECPSPQNKMEAA